MLNLRYREANLSSLIQNFPRWASSFERNPPFGRYGQLEFHVETIRRRREIGSASKAVQDDIFIASLYKTLRAWGIGVRASKLSPFEEFASLLRAQAPRISGLDGKTIDDPALNVRDVCRQVWELIDSLKIVSNNAQLVAASKALHHILPDLVVPIDRAYTQKFFCWQNPKFQYEQRACFEHCFVSFVRIARETHPIKYVRDRGWHSSPTKVIDNAIVGFISHQEPRAADEAEAFQMTPPAQNDDLGNFSTWQLMGTLLARPLAWWRRHR
jgi:hypothetical protein